MTTQGQLAQKGINAQNWAAMSLFLQYVTQQDFRYIGFEGKELEDFHLVFEDGRKIICESKASYINLSEIRKILDKIIKHAQVTDQDEILIVCERVNKEAKSLIENFKYLVEDIEKKLKSKKHKFKDKHLKLLPQLRFWEVNQDINRQAVEIFMAKVLSYPEPFWIPKHRLQELTKSLVEDKVYRGSQKGEILRGGDFLKLLESKKVQILEDDGYDYEKVRQTEEKEVKKIIKLIKSKSKKLNINNELVKLYANPSIYHFALRKLESEKDLKLSDWVNLWKATYQSVFSTELFKIFENNIQSKENQEFALDFVLSTIGGITSYFREEFIKYNIVKLCKKMLELNPSLEEKIFEVIKKVYKHSIDKFLYVKRRRDDTWEREEAAKLLEELYLKSKSRKLRSTVIDYIVNNFNVVKDDGRFWHYTPPSIFKILGKHVSGSPEILIPWFTKKCIEQYDKFYRTFGKKLEFNGWEHMGSGISQSGSSFSITDRHFVTQVLTPSLKKLYDTDKKKGLNFILKECLSLKGVTRDNPDFLNRAALPILLCEYRDGKLSEEIFGILKAFIRMRKGIPWKADLIFQAVRDAKLTDDEKWALVEVSLKKYENLPVNVFVEQITSDLAAKGHKQAIQAISDWAKDPEYAKRHIIGSFDVTDNAAKLLENSSTFDDGVGILKTRLQSRDFREKTDTFRISDMGKAIAKIMEKKPAVGIGLLKEINKSKTLAVNQQMAIGSALYSIPNEQKDNLLKVHKEFLKPMLKKLGDIKKIEKRFDHRHARDYFVQFAEKLVQARNFDEALWLIKVFINDSNPILENYPDDPNGDFNYHQKLIEGDDNPVITTVRGYCAWALQKFCALPGRDYIPRILPLVEHLTKDPNYYIRMQACVPLLELVKNRHTVISQSTMERFLSMKAAERIEDIAFAVLRNRENHKLKAVMKHLAMVFGYMRALNEERAMEVLKTFIQSKYGGVHREIASLLVFFAEFRKGALRDKKLKSLYGEKWEKLNKFDDRPFKELLVDQLKGGSEEMKDRFAWQFWQLPKEKGADFEKTFGISCNYLSVLTGGYDHEIFGKICYFIDENIDRKFDECFGLWKKCLRKERPYLIEAVRDKDNIHNVCWWPFYHNGRILMAVAKHRGEAEFLEWFDFLTGYPVEVQVAGDLGDAVGYLKKLPKDNKQVGRIFDKLIRRNANFLDDKQEWREGEQVRERSQKTKTSRE